jgi:hypothetical protein
MLRLVDILQENIPQDKLKQYLYGIYPTPKNDGVASIKDIVYFGYLTQKDIFDKYGLDMEFNVSKRAKHSNLVIDGAILCHAISSVYYGYFLYLKDQVNSKIFVDVDQDMKSVVFNISSSNTVDISRDMAVNVAKILVEKYLEEYILEGKLEILDNGSRVKIVLETFV